MNICFFVGRWKLSYLKLFSLKLTGVHILRHCFLYHYIHIFLYTYEVRGRRGKMAMQGKTAQRGKNSEYMNIILPNFHENLVLKHYNCLCIFLVIYRHNQWDVRCNWNSFHTGKYGEKKKWSILKFNDRFGKIIPVTEIESCFNWIKVSSLFFTIYVK